MFAIANGSNSIYPNSWRIIKQTNVIDSFAMNSNALKIFPKFQMQTEIIASNNSGQLWGKGGVGIMITCLNSSINRFFVGFFLIFTEFKSK